MDKASKGISLELRRKLCPYKHCIYKQTLMEIISFPFYEDYEKAPASPIKIMIRVPDTPATLMEVGIEELTAVEE